MNKLLELIDKNNATAINSNYWVLVNYCDDSLCRTHHYPLKCKKILFKCIFMILFFNIITTLLIIIHTKKL